MLKAFEDQSGITVKQVKSGDAGALVNQAILTKDHPQGDVLYGIDNTLLTKGLDAGLFEPYTSPELSAIDPSFDLDKDQHRVTPIDESDVCLNYDKRAFGGAGQPAAPTEARGPHGARVQGQGRRGESRDIEPGTRLSRRDRAALR